MLHILTTRASHFTPIQQFPPNCVPNLWQGRTDRQAPSGNAAFRHLLLLPCPVLRRHPWSLCIERENNTERGGRKAQLQKCKPCNLCPKILLWQHLNNEQKALQDSAPASLDTKCKSRLPFIVCMHKRLIFAFSPTRRGAIQAPYQELRLNSLPCLAACGCAIKPHCQRTHLRFCSPSSVP